MLFKPVNKSGKCSYHCYEKYKFFQQHLLLYHFNDKNFLKN